MSIETAPHGAKDSDTPFTTDALPDSLDGWALFLDIDGTLLDLALVPTEVIVPSWMPRALEMLAEKAGGALALVTGRAMDDADALFMPLKLPIAGLHGSDIRLPDGRLHKAPRSSALNPLREEFSALVSENKGLIMEDKGAGIAVHYRLAPSFGEAIIARMAEFVAGESEFVLQQGKMVVEVRPARTSKGTAVETFLSMPPFAGRKPLTIGDDITDETMFAVAEKNGGRAVRVGRPERPTVASAEVAGAGDVRQWIERFV